MRVGVLENVLKTTVKAIRTLQSEIVRFLPRTKWAVPAIIQLSSPSNQPLAQNDRSKPLRPHSIMALEADRLTAHSARWLRSCKSQRASPDWSQTCARRRKNTKRTHHPP